MLSDVAGHGLYIATCIMSSFISFIIIIIIIHHYSPGQFVVTTLSSDKKIPPTFYVAEVFVHA